MKNSHVVKEMLENENSLNGLIKVIKLVDNQYLSLLGVILAVYIELLVRRRNLNFGEHQNLSVNGDITCHDSGCHDWN